MKSSYKLLTENAFEKLFRRFPRGDDIWLVVTNSSWLLFDRLVRLLLGLFVGAWVARYLGPSEFGELAYVLAFIAFFQVVSTLGADSIVVRDLANSSSSVGEVLGTTFLLRLLVGGICWVLAIFVIIMFNGIHDRSVYLVALCGAVMIFQATDTIDLWFQSQSQNRRTVMVKLTSYVISSGLKISLILSEAPLIAFAAVVAIDAALCSLGLYALYKKLGTQSHWVYSREIACSLFKESWPFIISGLSIITYMRVDQIMIKQMLGAVELGLYSVVLPLSSLWYVIPMTLSVSLSPFVARKKQEGRKVYEQALLSIFRAFLVLGVLISLSVYLLSSFLITTIYGAAYEGAVNALRIHAFTIIPVFLGVARSLWIVNEKRPLVSLYAAFLGGAVSVVLNMVLIPQWGIAGASVSAVVSYFLSAVFLTVFFDVKLFLMQLGIRRGRKG